MDDRSTGATRRSFLKYGAATAVTAAAGASVVLSTATRADAVVQGTLYVLRGSRTMIDGLVVPVVGFGSTPSRVELPGGRLEVQAGDRVILTIHNTTDLPTGFTVPGVAGSTSPLVAPRTTQTWAFTAPSAAGAYFYAATINGSVETGRALGATGAFLVLPTAAHRRSIDLAVRERSARQPLFGTMTPPRIPERAAQERTWLFGELNPTTARDLVGGRVALPSDPEPEYFLLNGLSGMLSVEDHESHISGQAGGLGQLGETMLVRMINTGRAPRSIHMHGNHFWVLSHPDTPWLVGAHKDTVRIPPGRAVSVLLPMETPSDSWPVQRRGQKYVVHDHIEMAETASGGHYPAGMVSEILFD